MLNAMMQLPRLLLEVDAVFRLPNELSDLGVRNPLIITDQGLVRCGLFKKVLSVMDSAPAFEVFDQVLENPTYQCADEATRIYRAAGCDGVVAIGGGSVIDTAKFVAVLGSHEGRAEDFAGHPEKVTAATAPLVVVPTTAGTGSDSSPDAGIHPNSTTASLGITSPYIIAKVAICDPVLTVSLPPHLTAATGLDALSHCIEGYFAKSISYPVDALALDGVRRVFNSLADAVNNSEDLQARSQMMLAAFEGGAAISKGLGPAHAIAISCSDQGVHHGVLSALGLLACLDTIEANVPEKAAELGRAMQALPGQSLCEAVKALMKQLNLPLTLGDAGYSIVDIDLLAKASAESFFNTASPYVPSAKEYRKMIERIQ